MSGRPEVPERAGELVLLVLPGRGVGLSGCEVGLPGREGEPARLRKPACGSPLQVISGLLQERFLLARTGYFLAEDSAAGAFPKLSLALRLLG